MFVFINETKQYRDFFFGSFACKGNDKERNLQVKKKTTKFQTQKCVLKNVFD